MKKIISILIAVVLTCSLLACSSEFTLTADDMQKYADNKGGVYTDISADIISSGNEDLYDSVHQVVANGVMVQLWIASDTVVASWWYDVTSEAKQYDATVVSETEEDGTRAFCVLQGNDGTCTEVIFCNNLCVYATGGSQDAVDAVLEDLGVK